MKCASFVAQKMLGHIIELNGNATRAISGLGSIKVRAEVHVHQFSNILIVSDPEILVPFRR